LNESLGVSVLKETKQKSYIKTNYLKLKITSVRWPPLHAGQVEMNARPRAKWWPRGLLNA